MGRIFSVLVVLTAVLASTAAQAADDSGIRARVEQLVSQLVDEDQDKSARDVATEELAAILKASTDNAKDSARRHLTDIGMPLVHAIVDVLDSDSRTARLAACACLTELGAAAEGAVPYLLAPTVPDDAEFRIVARKAGARYFRQSLMRRLFGSLRRGFSFVPLLSCSCRRASASWSRDFQEPKVVSMPRSKICLTSV